MDRTSPCICVKPVMNKKAAELLSTTKLSVAEAAEQVGYINQSKFASVFIKAIWSVPTGIPAVKEFGKYIRVKPGLPLDSKVPAFLVPKNYL